MLRSKDLLACRARNGQPSERLVADAADAAYAGGCGCRQSSEAAKSDFLMAGTADRSADNGSACLEHSYINKMLFSIPVVVVVVVVVCLLVQLLQGLEPTSRQGRNLEQGKGVI